MYVNNCSNIAVDKYTILVLYDWFVRFNINDSYATQCPCVPFQKMLNHMLIFLIVIMFTLFIVYVVRIKYEILKCSL